MAIKFDIDSDFGPRGGLSPIKQEKATQMMKDAMQRQALHFVGQVQVKRLSGRPGLISRTAGGGLRRALNQVTYGKDLRSVESRIGWPKAFFWVKTHETGDTIHAKRKFLAIPFPGVTGATKSRASGSGLRPSDFPRDKTFFARGKNTKPGNLILFEKLAKGKIRPLFIMTPQVKIPARLGYFRLYDQEKPKMISAVLEEMASAYGIKDGGQ